MNRRPNEVLVQLVVVGDHRADEHPEQDKDAGHPDCPEEKKLWPRIVAENSVRQPDHYSEKNCDGLGWRTFFFSILKKFGIGEGVPDFEAKIEEDQDFSQFC